MASPPPDEGFTLLEVLISIAMIMSVFGAVSMFLAASTSEVRLQRAWQTAARLTDDGIGRARSLSVTVLLSGRDAAGVDAQWAAPVAGVDLADTQKAWDPSAAVGAGATATLRTGSENVVVGGLTYRRYFYVGECWQPVAGGSCTKTVTGVEFYRVIVAVTWTDNHCLTGTCSYVAATLVSSKHPDPVFGVAGS